MQEQDKFFITYENGNKVNCIALSIMNVGNKSYIIYKYENNTKFNENLLASEILSYNNGIYKLQPIENDEVWVKLEEKYRDLYNSVNNVIEEI